jgi:hypothetical protein
MFIAPAVSGPSPGAVERRAPVVPGADFGLQLASGLIQVAVDPSDQVCGSSHSRPTQLRLSFEDRMPFVPTLAACLVIILPLTIFPVAEVFNAKSLRGSYVSLSF